MNASRGILGFTLIVFTACGTSDTEAEKRVGSAVTSLSSPTWEFEGGGYSYRCSDECGAPNCNCVVDKCSGNVRGLPCATVGSICNLVNGNAYYQVLECEPGDPPPPPTWQRTSTDSCAEECGDSACSCILNRCSGNPEFQPCSNPGEVCFVIANGKSAELTCL